MPTTTTTSSSTSSSGTSATDTYFRESHPGRTYVVQGMDFDIDYLPAYQYGEVVGQKHQTKAFDQVTAEAQAGWVQAKGKSRLSWDQALPAVREAYDRTIRLYEERLKVGKEEVQAGEARLRKEVRTEHQEVTVPVQREELVVERRPVNQVVSGAEADLSGQEVRVPLREEKVTASKETVLTEEVSVGKRKVQEEKTVGADLKREELVVEGEGTAKGRTTGEKAG